MPVTFDPFFPSTAVVAIGEIGDKTQLLAMVLAARFRKPVPIILGILGATIGVAIREGSLFGILLAIPVLVIGLLGVAALALLWRSFMEFYVAIFKISEDLSALRQDVEAERARVGQPKA